MGGQGAPSSSRVFWSLGALEALVIGSRGFGVWGIGSGGSLVCRPGARSCLVPVFWEVRERMWGVIKYSAALKHRWPSAIAERGRSQLGPRSSRPGWRDREHHMDHC